MSVRTVQSMKLKARCMNQRSKTKALPYTPVQIPLNSINKLTTQEREILISNARQGIDKEFYKVNFCKNGSVRITKRSQPKHSKSDQILKRSGVKIAL